ncbi:unnamed protein product [Medioppia subpectinata]|uniref:Peptidase C1A papain C-terminal domain-containing protein n=1 Tax=Medioppia subpectinata TaxID=1979941 RepID=A0A7R9Q3S6_9ACAR|nr:unnamed protein product [Medioppia subpectinata]CAG2110740.1 unnamed protein product [Medioppia subpectinata]
MCRYGEEIEAPQFGDTYYVEAVLSLPYAEIKEPVVAYFDGSNNRSRVDYYGDLVQTIQRADLSDGGVNYKFAYMVDPKGNAQKVCFRINGTKEVPVTSQPLLPDLTAFKKSGTEICSDLFGLLPAKAVCTTGTIEGVYFVKSGHLVKLSEQQLIDCSWNEGDNGCDGGEDFRAYEYIMKANGLSTEDDYGHYLGVDGKCHDKSVKKTIHLKGFYNVTSGDTEALATALYYEGPVTVAIDASHKSLSFYSSGVYYEPNCGNKPENLDHQVLAVGFGSLKGEKYWLIKNSWSTYWGNDGYVLMSQKENNCGVTTEPTFPIIADH